MATERDLELEQCESPLSCSTITTLEKLQLCCKPTYKPRRVKNKGAILVLVWNYMIMSVYGMFNQYLVRVDQILLRVWVVAFGITPPIAGWLADARVGRYKVMRCSIWIMWIVAVLTTVSSVISQLVDAYSCIDTIMQVVLLVFTAIGLGGYQASIVQFGLDQLQDASTIEITSFIVWYIWTTVSACFVMDFGFTCLSEEQNNIIMQLFVSFNLTLALLLLLRYNYWLLKEPVKENPFRLIYKVIKYTVKHKHPRLRSAFTYCEDNLPTRIDFGKSKYGGPFTTEQVEDVKTFLRLIPMALIAGVLGGGLFTTDYLRDKVYEVIADFNNLEALQTSNTKIKLTECYHKATISRTVYYSSVVLIVIHEIFIYPVFHRCLPQIESLQKIIIGMLLQITRVFVLLAYVITLHLTSEGQIQCLFNQHKSDLQAQNTTFSYYWITIPDFVNTISFSMLCIGAVEFLSSQTPKNMRGIMIGATYCSLFVSSGVWFVLLIPFTKKSSVWGTRTINCGFWLSLILAIIQVCICLFLIILARWYKTRRRQDVLPNEHIFAERYYSRDT